MDKITEENKKLLDGLLNDCKSNLRHVNEDLIRKSFDLCYESHKNHFRASGESYFYHPIAVAKIVASEIPLDDVSVIAALLHDVVEDTEISLDFIKDQFGKEVAEIVNGVTKITGVFKGHEITQAENYRKLLLSMVEDVRVILVKFADRLHNMRTLQYVSPDKQRRIAKETLEIYAPFAHRFGLGRVKWELEDLAFKYLNKAAYDDLAKKLKNKRKERESYIAKFIKPIEEKLISHNLKFEIGGRPKHLYSIYRKMIKQNLSFEKIFDLLAVRIILESDDQNDCYYVLGVTNQQYTPIPDRFKDYISIPKKNNYQSIHNTVISSEGKLVEVQIRTRKMHEIAEKGVAAHWKYKENLFSSDADLEDWVNWIRDIFENASKDEATEEILASFKLNLYQDEIYVFTPKGDLRRLPVGSTPVDFAFDIHSNIGSRCIGAKVNGRIVPLDTNLQSGDQVDIITSKNQHPSKSWLEFVQTHKAKSNIRKFINKEESRLVESGKEIWEKKLKKYKLVFNSEDINKLIRKLKYQNQEKFFAEIARNKVDLDGILNPEEEKVERISELGFDSFVETARTSAGDVIVEGQSTKIEHTFAKCCNPIPGDPIVGFITIGTGIKIHRRDCKNLLNTIKNGDNKLVPVDWPRSGSSRFVAGIAIRGEDKPGTLNEISHNITSFRNTNIKSVNITAFESMFDGAVTLYVENLEHLNRLIDRLKKIPGVYSVRRFDANA
ncbi:MAG: bifunctional (p)ppGpp synthetase/guanosine-3',5'-bis(diphosphate) 3'-pyrophosphohydrolase [Melioribacteraceae bacterium]|nr:bifunctional (p)ppGpp synthetase/guanosine-3',5'-bis(diphosphate) 3'-pyrophosphohydrolase [Melioribacteraceae bacterium]MCF8263808.1 bifunctional (p)ppGpp synthetase/guanosine-3',5'-bis(diphosphate) 3'-pyrophosphohydrolase [Melioribacteraceae bacterium]MCF8412105.1 bifunctional (p)ppGpp synthetase/guanosine-3',5'-bis(diphosphate) 3'-pyrophosphohydrolase [Melioribacteraceae bacterium]